jgi:AmmeMemoRadiSam system protein A
MEKFDFEREFGIKKDSLFEIAKTSILYFLKNKKFPEVIKKGKKAATFVTLFENNELRGCIGSLQAIRAISEDVSINAINAAFFDPRFLPLTEEELEKNKDNIEIEISVLTPMKKFEGSLKEWINFLIREKPGVFIVKDGYSATFLPDVWKQLPDPFDFMNHLAIKAGMNVTDWVEAEKYYYYTISFKKGWNEINENWKWIIK